MAGLFPFLRRVGTIVRDVRAAFLQDDSETAEGDDSLGFVIGPQRTYDLLRHVAAGEVADIYLASAAGSHYAVKVSRLPEECDLQENERKVLIRRRTQGGDTTYRKYLPSLVESFAVIDEFPKRVSVFQYEAGFTTLEQVHERHAALDGGHLAWIFKRLLSVLGFCHTQHRVHGAILPDYVLIHAANHGLQLAGWERQGSLRCGWLDLPLLRYAAAVASPFDGLVVNHRDQLTDGECVVCDAYKDMSLQPAPAPNLSWQSHLAEQLAHAVPVLSRVRTEGILDAVNAIAPVVLTGVGPTHEDRRFVDLRFRNRKGAARE